MTSSLSLGAGLALRSASSGGRTVKPTGSEAGSIADTFQV